MTVPDFLFLYIAVAFAFLFGMMVRCIAMRIVNAATTNDSGAGSNNQSLSGRSSNSHNEHSSTGSTSSIENKRKDDALLTDEKALQTVFLNEYSHRHSKVVEESDLLLVSHRTTTKPTPVLNESYNNNSGTFTVATVATVCSVLGNILSSHRRNDCISDDEDSVHNTGVSIGCVVADDEKSRENSDDHDSRIDLEACVQDAPVVDRKMGTTTCVHRPLECCYICLEDFRIGDKITWSSTESKCKHIFHQSCIMDWLHRTGTKTLQKLISRRHLLRNENNTNEDHHPVPTIAILDVEEQPMDSTMQPPVASSIAPFHRNGTMANKGSDCIRHVPYLCPVCRQDFIVQTQC